jgi:hypothetical protein
LRWNCDLKPKLKASPNPMNPAHLHLMLTHVPILGSVFGLVVLLTGLGGRNREFTRLSLWIFVVSGLCVVPTYLTGRPASAVLTKMMPAMSADTGDQHAEVAVIAMVASCVLGVAALAGICAFRKAKPIPGWFISVIVALGLVTTASMVWTASLGGKIRHPEVEGVSP